MAPLESDAIRAVGILLAGAGTIYYVARVVARITWGLLEDRLAGWKSKLDSMPEQDPYYPDLSWPAGVNADRAKVHALLVKHEMIHGQHDDPNSTQTLG